MSAPAASPVSSPAALFAGPLLENPYPLYAGLRASNPVFAVPVPADVGAGVFLLTRHADVQAALKDSRLSADRRNSDAIDRNRAVLPRQVLGELILINVMAMLVGTVLVVQLPFFDALDWVPGSILAGGLLAAVVTILTIGLAAGLYPSWITTRIQPAEALHHD